jgi:hypothetical protein
MALATRTITARPTGRTEPQPFSHGEIARLAYSLWEQRGRTHGRDVSDWTEAERLLTARQSNNRTFR